MALETLLDELSEVNNWFGNEMTIFLDGERERKEVLTICAFPCSITNIQTFISDYDRNRVRRWTLLKDKTSKQKKGKERRRGKGGG